MERHASATSFIGAWTAVFGGLSSTEVAAYGGLIVGVVGMLVNWYYKAKEDKRQERMCIERARRADDKPRR